jgi:hypothetical protein
MRFRVFGTLFALVLATLAASCGSDSTRPDPEWQPTARTPYTGDRWWWTPVERHCEEDEDCEAGETCVRMQLGTCPRCPRGEDEMVCQGPNEEGPRRAQQR